MTDIRTDMLRITRRRIAKAKGKAQREFGRDQSSWPEHTRRRFDALKGWAKALQKSLHHVSALPLTIEKTTHA